MRISNRENKYFKNSWKLQTSSFKLSRFCFLQKANVQIALCLAFRKEIMNKRSSLSLWYCYCHAISQENNYYTEMLTSQLCVIIILDLGESNRQQVRHDVLLQDYEEKHAKFWSLTYYTEEANGWRFQETWRRSTRTSTIRLDYFKYDVGPDISAVLNFVGTIAHEMLHAYIFNKGNVKILLVQSDKDQSDEIFD